MRNATVFLLGVLVAVSAVARSAKEDPNRIVKLKGGQMTVGELNRLMEEIDLERTGGTIRQANSAKGTFVVLNAQTNVATVAYREDVEEGVGENIYVQMAFKDVNVPVSCANAKSVIAQAGGVLGAVVVNDPTLPALVTAPEDGWSLVNVAALSADRPKPAVLVSRVSKEILRAFAFVSGGAYLARAPYVMRDVKTLRNLDMIPVASFGLEVSGRINEASGLYGLIPWRQSSYLQACREGWAPAPTNKYQKAIWDKVHAAPTKPIVIKPETKKKR